MVPTPVPIVDRSLRYRRIDPASDGQLAYAHYRETCIASFGAARRCISQSAYLRWLADRVDEFPDGHLLALLQGQVVGQLELQVPYGSDCGYVNLFWVAGSWRRLGLGRRMHDFALTYFRSWEARRIELHVSPTNHAAVAFYRSLGYRLVTAETNGDDVWLMERAVP
jgi:ribosomal protein S18 acetylase RimI-like enzyme